MNIFFWDSSESPRSPSLPPWFSSSPATSANVMLTRGTLVKRVAFDLPILKIPPGPPPRRLHRPSSASEESTAPQTGGSEAGRKGFIEPVALELRYRAPSNGWVFLKTHPYPSGRSQPPVIWKEMRSILTDLSVQVVAFQLGAVLFSILSFSAPPSPVFRLSMMTYSLTSPSATIFFEMQACWSARCWRTGCLRKAEYR